MSGYKRVNYYELCRLCATNQQKEKTHIFQEEGRKIQLLNKIQSCLSLTVYEHDFLPKVVCSKCLKSLESYYTFKQECVSSETMLSSYFKNFRYTEDFKKSGKVYIKDTSMVRSFNEEANLDNVSSSTAAPIVVTSTQTIQVAGASQNTQQNASLLQNYVALTGSLNEQNKPQNGQNSSQVEQVQSFYAVQLPTQTALVGGNNQGATVEQQKTPKSTENVTKIVQQHHHNHHHQHHQLAYNLNTVNLSSTNNNNNAKNPQKPTAETLNNVVVNANGEVINIGHLVDLESMIMNQVSASAPKISKNSCYKPKRSIKESKNCAEEGVVKIDLTENEHSRNNNNNNNNNASFEPDKLPHIKRINNNNNNSNQNAKFSVFNNGSSNVPSSSSSSQKIEEKIQVPTVIFNAVSEYQVPMSNFLPFHHQNNGGNNNFPGTTPNGNHGNGASSTQPSTVNLNALNSDVENHVNNNNNNNNLRNNFKRETAVKNDSAAEESCSTAHSQGAGGGANATEKLHVCDICRRSFKRREHLYQHIKLHTGFRPYTCENCNKSFMRKEHLLRHMTSHSGQKNYTCNVCEKSFSRNDNLLKHKKTHEKQNSFTCEVCQKQFVMKHYYLAHKVTHEVVERCIGQTLGILKA